MRVTHFAFAKMQKRKNAQPKGKMKVRKRQMPNKT